MTPRIIYDDADSDIIISGRPHWRANTGVASAYRQTTTTYDPVNTTTGLKPQLEFFFYGSDVAIYGPPVADNVSISYTIDGSRPRPLELIRYSSAPQHGLKLWGLENLDMSYHDIEIIPESGSFSYDYIAFTPNRLTQLARKRLIMDDNDSELQYSSGWTSASNTTIQSITSGIPYNNSLKGTNTVSASMSFNFTGSSVSVFGSLNQQAGRLAFSYSVNNSVPETVTLFTGAPIANNSWYSNRELFHKDLVPGKHSVNLQLLEATDSQMLWVDYVAFEGTSTTTLTATSSIPTPTAVSSSTNPLGTGQIAAIVIVALILFFCCCFGQKAVEYGQRRRRRSTDEYHMSETANNMGHPVIIVVPPSNQPSAIIHNYISAAGTMPRPQMTDPSQSSTLPAYQPPNPPARDAGPVEAPPPYNPNLYTR
ncbi:hypothetical protein CVT24_004408 [Panaeolus cyanescens]|uniref:Transmembrane protein n=1 Tax=Panaeolus cyanescens TaxID=181874 RepID=A0A409YBI7_9AGAR|nr:hypothetical protein CVT24_004408 [Panaeolus cyanescens]